MDSRLFLQEKNCCLILQGGAVDSIHFGSGQKALVINPGVGDELKTVKGIGIL